MNVDDVNPNTIEIPDGNQIWPAMFQRQRELAIKYGPIEERNGFFHADPRNQYHIDDSRFQHWIKDFFWRTTEEIAEAMESLNEDVDYLRWRGSWDSDASLRHFFEEMADATHFLIEVSLPFIDPQFVVEEWASMAVDMARISTDVNIRLQCVEFIGSLGLAANCLKNKPWKSTQMPTDRHKFVLRLKQAWRQFMCLWIKLGWSAEDVFKLYVRKNTVNLFRQRSNY